MDNLSKLEAKLRQEIYEYQYNLTNPNVKKQRFHYNATNLGKLLLEGDLSGISQQQYIAAYNFIKLKKYYLLRQSQTAICASKKQFKTQLSNKEAKSAYNIILQALTQNFTDIDLKLMEIIFFDHRNLSYKQLRKAAPMIRQICNRLTHLLIHYAT